jgi:hypothetical protein
MISGWLILDEGPGTQAQVQILDFLFKIICFKEQPLSFRSKGTDEGVLLSLSSKCGL